MIAMVRFINKDGEKFVEQFLPEISTKFGGIIQDLLNRWIIDWDECGKTEETSTRKIYSRSFHIVNFSALQNLESRYLIN